ncbi:MAG: hypothetical protein M5U09_13320 [Gammaproteobacteria bacterium]|nr:hypothetical protein [Gammaproteobacteria bacterium]
MVRDYGDVDAEYRAAREAVALFDFSFMSRARLSGRGALSCLNGFRGRAIDALPVGRIAYCLHTDARSTVTSDLTVWNCGADTFDVYSGDPRDVARLAGQGSSGVAIEDLSDSTAIFALQGPGTPRVLGALCRDDLAGLEYFGFRSAVVAGVPCVVGRLGYTGEKGVELIVDRDLAATLWHALSSVARPAGFAAADRLRIEAGFILFVNDCALPVYPGELGLGRFAPRVGTVERVRLTGFRCNGVLETEPWRPQGSPVLPVSGEITITSACRDGDGGVLGLGFVPAGEASPGAVAVDRTGRFGPVRQVPMPVHDPAKARPRGPWR